MKITVIIPAYNECETLSPLAEQVRARLGAFEHRIVFIDDGSTDDSWDVLRTLHAKFEDIDAVRFRENFGKTSALAAGFARAEGDLVITMDADLQDDPKELGRFIDKINEGFDVVSGWKVRRHDPWTKTFPSKVYNRLISFVFGLELHDINCGFKALRTNIAKQLPLRGDMHRLIPVLAAQIGARITEIPVEHHPRRCGSSKYGVERFWRGIRDAASAYVTAGRTTRAGLPDTSGCVAEELRH